MIIEERKYNLNGHKLVLKNATADDAQVLIDYLKTVCGETPYLIKEPEEISMTLEEEISFINSQNNSEKNLLCIGLLDGNYVGNCSINGTSLQRFKHRGEIGIALYQNYTGMGIGSIMLDRLIEVGRESGYEQMELEVVSDNKRAIALYEKKGFKKYGTFPNNMKYKDGTYADADWMMLKL